MSPGGAGADDTAADDTGAGDTGAGDRLAGVGFDLTDAHRLAASLARRPGLAERLFTEAEREALEARRGDPLAAAGRFAAKEAVMKALGRGVDAISFTDIEVDSERGLVRLSGRAASRAAELGVVEWSLGVGAREGPGGPVAAAEVLALRR